MEDTHNPTNPNDGTGRTCDDNPYRYRYFVKAFKDKIDFDFNADGRIAGNTHNAKDIMWLYVRHGDQIVNHWYRSDLPRYKQFEYFNQHRKIFTDKSEYHKYYKTETTQKQLASLRNLENFGYDIAIGNLMYTFNDTILSNQNKYANINLYRTSQYKYHLKLHNNQYRFQGLVSTAYFYLNSQDYGNLLILIKLPDGFPCLTGFNDAESECLLPTNIYFRNFVKLDNWTIYLSDPGLYPTSWELWLTSWPTIISSRYKEFLDNDIFTADIKAQFAFLFMLNNERFWKWYLTYKKDFNWSRWPMFPINIDALLELLPENTATDTLHILFYANLLKFQLNMFQDTQVLLQNCDLLDRLKQGKAIKQFDKNYYTYDDQYLFKIVDSPVETAIDIAVYNTDVYVVRCFNDVVLEGMILHNLDGNTLFNRQYTWFACGQKSYLVTDAFSDAHILSQIASTLTENDRLGILLQLLTGLWFAEQSSKFNHNDLTSANIALLDKNYQATEVKILGIPVKIPKCRFVVKLINFDHSRITDHGGWDIINAKTLPDDQATIAYVYGKDIHDVLKNQDLISKDNQRDIDLLLLLEIIQNESSPCTNVINTFQT